MFKAIEYTFDHNDYVQTVVSIPDDLITTPILPDYSVCEDERVTVCHSDSENKWYILRYKSAPFSDHPDINTQVLCSGSFIDCSSFMCIDIATVPFQWGVQLKSKSVGSISYLPIWESVLSGEVDDEGFERTKIVYKLITCIMPNYDSLYDRNCYSDFYINEYDDVVSLIKDIEYVTGVRF